MKLLRWLDANFEEVLLMASIVLIVIIMGLQVFMRYFIGRSLSWPEEISRYLFVWFSFLGMSYAIKYNINLKIEFIQIIFPNLSRHISVIGDAIYLTFCLIMIKPAFSAFMTIMQSKQSSPAIHLPMWVVYLSFLVSICLSLVRLVQKYVILFRKKNEKMVVG
jgi:TRAP-type C4-dicarboxylate transport system permease small subunit